MLRVYQLLKLGRGAVIELNQKTNDPVEILANEVPIARGEVIVTDDGNIGVTLTELITKETLEKMIEARENGAAVVVLGFCPADPAKYGRLILRDERTNCL